MPAAEPVDESADDLRDRLRAEPFEPFRLVMANGERIDIPAPACLGLHGERIFVGFDYDPVDDIPEYGDMLWRNQIVDVQPLEAAAARAAG